MSANEVVDERMLSSIEEREAQISIPIREVLAGVGNGEEVRMVNFLFRNMSGLLPDRLDDTDNTRLAGSNNDNVRCIGRQQNNDSTNYFVMNLF